MSEMALDPTSELATIRGLMERARDYRHPPAPVGFVAGFAAVAGGIATHHELALARDAADAASVPNLSLLAALWVGVFLVSFLAVVYFTSRAARLEGTAFWSPLAKDVVHALWPSLVGAGALSLALARAGHLELVVPLWLLAYGTGGIAAGAFASPIVRRLGAMFLFAGLADLVLLLPPGIVLAATFGGFHLLYGVLVLVRPRGRE